MRKLTSTFRDDLEALQSDEVIVFMAKIYSEEMPEAVYVNSDVVDYVYNDFNYIGFAFRMSLLTDDEQPPRAKISVPNVDRRIGELFLGLTKPLRLKVDIVLRSAFNDEVPRRPVGAVVAEYTAPALYMRNISVDALTVSADIMGFDLSSEPYPRIRSTEDLLPGLFR